MEIEVRYRNGINKEGIVSVPFDYKFFNTSSLYKTFVNEYFIKIKKEDVIILLKDGYPINDFRLEKLKLDLNNYIDRSIEVDVYFTEVWENKVKLGRKRKRKDKDTIDLEPEKKKRKLLR